MVAGCHVTSRDDSYRSVLALVDGGQLIDVVDLSSPGAEADAAALEQLRVRVRDVLRDRKVSRLALWRYEGSPGDVRINAVRPIVRAEGAILASAGEAGVEVIEVSATSERRVRKFKNNKELVSALLSGIGGPAPPDGAERAVAAAAVA